MKRGLLIVGISIATVLFACGGDDKGASSSGGTSGTSGTTSGGTSGSSGDPSSSGGGGSDAGTSSGTPAPKSVDAPKLTQLMKMTGSLHVVWNLPKETDCDKIEGERKSATEPYKVVWTVPGTVDNKHDGTATSDTTYTYRLRCKVGTDYSEYSNEMSGNPKQ